jgi:uncharacterized membrane protein
LELHIVLTKLNPGIMSGFISLFVETMVAAFNVENQALLKLRTFNEQIIKLQVKWKKSYLQHHLTVPSPQTLMPHSLVK